MKSSKLTLGIGLFSLLGVLFLYMAGFFTAKINPQESALTLSASEISALETVELQSSVHNQYRQFTGTVVADQKASLSALLTAQVAETLVDAGASVTKGDVLMRLESDDLDARVMQSEQGLSSAQAQLNAARKEYQRVSELVNKKLLPQSEYDRVKSQLDTTTAKYKQTQAAVREAETTFGFSIITSPFDGVITTRPINQGDTAGPGTLLVTLYNPKTLQLEVNISESLINDIQIGTVLPFELPTFEKSGAGKVVEIVPAADSTSRSFLVKIALEGIDKVYPGVFGKVSVKSETLQALHLPEEAVYRVGQLDYVKVLKEDQVRTQLVQLSSNNIVRKGVEVGDVVILNPLDIH
ncbi:efflux RND transporter periplasmic adaptor subunit [Vibrio tapetis]|uniref:Putative Secretion protein HlyD n=1 Tax=Vibrio tapetis subsp. tapetis TaxID=1671868 RepID=A0A2N8ZN53_9VIBR|nr:efflux RND transporter periplasmic adaptor subunit [Vibrio tapetis]SON53289.1 putative Secretion protein HlyD [Vibrio tapetis subsp. tapetis]